MEWAVVAAASTVALALLAFSGATARIDNLFYDAVTRLAVRPPSGDIVVVAIDNRSIAALGRWPWPRAQHEALLRRLAEARPRAVAYDVLFVDPDRDPAADAALAEAMGETRVFTPLSFDIPGVDGAPFTMVPPVPPVRAAAAGVGHVNIEFDTDGVVRRAYLGERAGTAEWPHLMELMFRAARGAPSEAWSSADPPRGQGLARGRPVMVAFTARPGDFRTVSFVDLVRGETPAVFLRDKLVLVGATADGLGDRYATPLSDGAQVMPGVELQANLLDTLLSDRGVRAVGGGLLALLTVIPLWALLAGFLLLKPRTNMVLGAGLALGVLAAAGLALMFGRLWVPPAAALIGLVLVYPLWSWRRLEASSAFMVAELGRFAGEADPLPKRAEPAAPAGDVIGRQMDLMEAALGRARDLRGFLGDIVQGLPDATVVADVDERVLVANRAADGLFRDLLRASPVGRRLDDLAAPLTAGAPDPETGDVEMAAPDGRSFAVRRTSLQSAGGGLAGWIVRYVDISGLKAAARQREDILQLLTHDMRSPQVSILALLDSQAEEGALADRIRGYARRTLDLADDFVHLARAESGHMNLETLDLAELATDALDDLWPQSNAKQIVVVSPEAEEPFLVSADRGLLTRALINLVDNAIKFTAPGGRIECRVTATPGRVICVISDTGRGMAADEVEHVFERFRRAASAEAQRIDGAGLGLAFVQAVVQRHGGVITCASTPGVGTRFEIALPRVADDEAG